MKLITLLPLLAFGVGCDLLMPADAPPPPPPPPPAVVEAPPAPELPMTPPPPVARPAEATLLPPPWGDLGFTYGSAAVLHSDAGTVVLTLPSTATAEIEALYAAWQKSLVDKGFAAGPSYVNGLDAGEPWTHGPRKVSIARGVVGTSAYLYAEDLQKGSVSAVDKHTVDDSVSALMTKAAPPTAKAAATSSSKQVDYSQGVGATPDLHRDGKHKDHKDKKDKKDRKHKKDD